MGNAHHEHQGHAQEPQAPNQTAPWAVPQQPATHHEQHIEDN